LVKTRCDSNKYGKKHRPRAATRLKPTKPGIATAVATAVKLLSLHVLMFAIQKTKKAAEAAFSTT
jgi:hypothetical protein